MPEMAKPKSVVIVGQKPSLNSNNISAHNIQIGGSLAGLFAGLVLKRLGHHVRILERNPMPLLHDQGAGIVYGAFSQEYFSKYVKNQRDFSITSYLRQTLDKTGKSISDQEERYQQQMISWDLVYFVLRAEFDGVEDGYIDVHVPLSEDREGDAEYQYGCAATGLKDLGDRVEVEFRNKDGEMQTISGDLILGGDGPSSSLRKILLPDVERTYAGYVAWRGTVPESEASQSLEQTFVDHFTFFHDHSRGIQILAYLIPGAKGTLQPGSRLINWVWYCNYPQGSPENKELMTDSEGKSHHYTLPVGKVQQHVWMKQKKYAQDTLPPQFAELVDSTKQPFVQAITDVLSPKSSFMGGKVMLIGDAVAGFRPHTAGGTSQAAYHAILLDRVLRGEIDWVDMEKLMLDHARYMSRVGITIGNRSQFNQR